MDQDAPATRARLLGGLVGAVVGAAAAGAAAAAGDGRTVIYPDPDSPFGDPNKDVVIGRLERVISTTRFVLRVDRVVLPVELASGAAVLVARNSELRNYWAGEQLAVEGRHDGETFQASAVAPLLDSFEAIIERRTGAILETTVGPIRITRDTNFAAHPGSSLASDTAGGGKVAIHARTHPTTAEMFAIRVAPVR